MHTGSGRSHETPPLVTPMKAATRSFPSRPASMASPRGSSSSGFDFRAAVLGEPTEKERRWWESSLSSLESVDGLATVARPVLQDLVGLCFNCFSEDHVRAACPNAAKCLRCKEGGHLAIDCTRPRSSKVAPSAAMGAPSRTMAQHLLSCLSDPWPTVLDRGHGNPRHAPASADRGLAPATASYARDSRELSQPPVRVPSRQHIKGVLCCVGHSYQIHDTPPRTANQITQYDSRFVGDLIRGSLAI